MTKTIKFVRYSCGQEVMRGYKMMNVLLMHLGQTFLQVVKEESISFS